MNTEIRKNLLKKYAFGKEDFLIEKYIAQGPMHVSKELGLIDSQWEVIFDYLVFQHNLLYKTVISSEDFFVDTYVRHGMTHVRDILNVTDKKYDEVWEMIFDYLAVSREGLFYHFVKNRERYTEAFKARGGDFVRKVLGIWKRKYDEHWRKILDSLLNAACDEMFSKRDFDSGLKSFSMLINGVREHRPISKHKLW